MPISEITDDNLGDFLFEHQFRPRGLEPRDYAQNPSGCYSVAPTFDTGLVIPQNEWASRLKDQQDAKASLFDIRQDNYDTLKSLDQNPYGLCWAFSTTKAIMYTRILMGASPLVLSAWWVAGKIKGWRDQGGWGAASLQYVVQNGVPEMRLCPKYNSSYDTAETRANAALHKATEWWDGTNNRDQNMRIMVTAFLMGLPPVLDFNWWGHSVCGCRLVSLDPLTIDIDNSWGESMGDKGIYRLVGSKAIPDGIVVPRVSMAA